MLWEETVLTPEDILEMRIQMRLYRNTIENPDFCNDAAESYIVICKLLDYIENLENKKS